MDSWIPRSPAWHADLCSIFRGLCVRLTRSARIIQIPAKGDNSWSESESSPSSCPPWRMRVNRIESLNDISVNQCHRVGGARRGCLPHSVAHKAKVRPGQGPRVPTADRWTLDKRKNKAKTQKYRNDHKYYSVLMFPWQPTKSWPV